MSNSHDNAGHDHGGHDHGGHAHHAHGPGGHSHAPANFGRAFLIGIALNAAFVLAEVVFGLAGHSVALLAEMPATNSATSSASLWPGPRRCSRSGRRRPASPTASGGASILLAALFNAVFLLVVIGALTWEAIGRFSHPEPVAGKTVMIVAAGGIIINGLCAWLFASGRKGDLNVRGAFTHMAADALVSVGVVVAGFVILMTGWLWLDPVVSIAINAVIVMGTWSLLRDSVAMSMNAVPEGLDLKKIDAFLGSRPGIVRDPRPARLVHEHDRRGAYRPRSDARRTPGRSLPWRCVPIPQGEVRHRARNDPDRDRRDDRLRSCPGRGGLRSVQGDYCTDCNSSAEPRSALNVTP